MGPLCVSLVCDPSFWGWDPQLGGQPRPRGLWPEMCRLPQAPADSSVVSLLPLAARVTSALVREPSGGKATVVSQAESQARSGPGV